MKGQLSIKTDTGYISMGDSVKIKLKELEDGEDIFIGTVVDIFNSAWTPFEIRINISSRLPHMSIGIDNIEYMELYDRSEINV